MSDVSPYSHAFIRGEIVPIEKATISIMTNGLHYGVGLFEGIKAYDTPQGVGIFRLDDHLQRMGESCKTLRFPINFDISHAKGIILDLARKNNLRGTTYIRPLLYRSDERLSPDIDGDYDLAIYMLPMDQYVDTTKGLSAQISSWRRNSDNALPPRTKATGGYLNSAIAIHDAHRAGFDSAIMLDENGNVSEGAVMNLFVVKSGKLMTPTVGSDILEGVTRRTVLEIAEDMNIPLSERTISRTELYSADELFFCGTAYEVAWCRAVDHVEISKAESAITSKIRMAFSNLLNSKNELYTMV